jgi:hypothetical protein
MGLLKTAAPSDDDTPNRRLVNLIDFQVSSEFASGILRQRNTRTRQCNELSSSSALTSSLSRPRSDSRPIPITMDEKIHRYRELQDMAEAESFYANATWRMYRRITKYRIDHPLPDCYFEDVMSQSDDLLYTNNDDSSVVTPDQTIENTVITSMISDHKCKDHEDSHPSARPFNSFPQQVTSLEDDDEHCMMFELDLS